MRSTPWKPCRGIPAGVAAVLSALRFTGSPEPLGNFTEAEWQAVLSFCDRSQLTLLLGGILDKAAPDWVRRRIQRNLADNAKRFERLRHTCFEISDALLEQGIEHVVLKGLTQWPRYTADPRLRVQYDLDFFCPGESVRSARDVLVGLGFEPLEDFEKFPTDHLPVMIRKTGWQWRGDFFDPEIPVSVDLHFRFWDEATEGFGVPGLEPFWSRRVRQQVGGRELPSLHPADSAGYTALHLLRHLLRGSVRVAQVYEVAYFLHTHANNEAFWRSWRELHDPALRRLEVVVFRLAADWFGCHVSNTVHNQMESLPAGVRAWFERHSKSPVEGFFKPNKDELFLHLCLLSRWRDKLKVARRRLLPVRLPGPVDGVYVPEDQLTWRLRLRRRARYASYLASRVFHHARALPAVLWSGARCWCSPALPNPYWTFLASASLFNFGVFLFVLLYNLFLLDRGFKEAFLGLVTAATTAGSIAGALAAGALARWSGLRNTLLVSITGMAIVTALRVLIPGAVPLVVLGFLAGTALSVWMVSVAPAVARLTDEESRAAGFSIFFAAGIALGVLGGVVGGRLPRWVAATAGVASPAIAKQIAVLAGCVAIATAAWPVLRLEFPEGPREGRSIWPRGSFVVRFLSAVAIWNLATGSFNPFFNAYFSRHQKLAVDQVGLAFSGGQAAQVLAVLLAPIVLRRFGTVAGIAGMQLATGAALAGLALAPSGGAALVAYGGYMAFQWMSEPGLYSLLMGRVSPSEQNGASALNFVAVFCAQAVAAAAAGFAFTRFGYPAVLGLAAGLALLAGAAFRLLLRRYERAKPQDTES